jgi:hypothetical protein
MVGVPQPVLGVIHVKIQRVNIRLFHHCTSLAPRAIVTPNAFAISPQSGQSGRVAEDVREPLVRQWRLVARAITSLDLDASSRVEGWRNREVLAHLALQPKLLASFLETSSTAPPQVSLVANLSGTATLADVIDRAARHTRDEELTFAENVESVIPALRRADLAATVTTIQGPIVLRDYIVTRCVEAVVHGCDFSEPIEPDTAGLEIARAALRAVMSEQHPELLALVDSLSPMTWVNVATGRETPPRVLEGCCPLMT